MKKIVLFLLVFFTVSVFGQRRDFNDKKMVSSVLIKDYRSDGSVRKQTSVSYVYDRFWKLSGVTADFGEGKVTIVKKGERLISNVYDYEINESGYITSKILVNKIDGKWVKKVTKYKYEADCDVTVLTQISRQQFVKGDGIWYPSHDIEYINFDYWDGDCYWEKMHSSDFNIRGERTFYGGVVKYREGKYGRIRNDLNINPNLFFSMLCWEICLDEHDFELSTEWCGMLSDYIIINENGFNIETQVDNDGNISKMLTRYKNGKVFRDMVIDYVY